MMNFHLQKNVITTSDDNEQQLDVWERAGTTGASLPHTVGSRQKW